MRTRTTTETLYQFDELSNAAQAHALEQLWDLNVDDSYWFESITEDIEQFGDATGLGCTYGAEFDCDRGRYVHITNFCTTVTELRDRQERCVEYPNLNKQAMEPFFASFTPKEWAQLLRLEKAEILGTLSGETSKQRRGIRADVERFDPARCPRMGALLDKLEEAWAELLRDIEHEYVNMLDREWEYQTDREQVIESMRANEYEFTEDGELA